MSKSVNLVAILSKLIKFAINCANREEIDLTEVLKPFRNKRTRYLASVCFYMQLNRDEFGLTCRDAGAIMGISGEAANKTHLKKLLASGFLVIVKKGYLKFERTGLALNGQKLLTKRDAKATTYTCPAAIEYERIQRGLPTVL